MSKDFEQAVSTVSQELVNYLTSDEGSKARKRMANRDIEKELTGADGITRKVVSKAIGAFWEVPEKLASRVERTVKALAQLKQNRYLSFQLGSVDFEVGAVSLNSLTKKFEIWFAKKGLLGSPSVTTEDLISQLSQQKVERMVVPIDTAGMQSATTKEKVEAVKEAHTVPATDDDLPF